MTGVQTCALPICHRQFLGRLVWATCVRFGRTHLQSYRRGGRGASVHRGFQPGLHDSKHLFARNSDNLWTHTKYGYSLPRRNGKNEVVAIRELYGLFSGEKGLHTAHRTTTSHAAFERLLKFLNDMGFVEKEDYKALRQFGLEKIEMIKEYTGIICFRTRSAKGGLGEGFDYLIIDEAQEYTDDQESALKYVVTDSKNPQSIFCGTRPTAVSNSTVFTKMPSKIGRASCRERV